MFVLIENNIVVQAISGNPFNIFDHQFASRFIEAPDHVVAGWKFDGSDFIEPPTQDIPKQPIIIPHLENKNKAMELLSKSDWVELPSVTNTEITPHLLNKSEFDTYRQQLRDIAVNPPDNIIEDWPVMPIEHWNS